tara:strand:+ start:3629 stop:4777 length:1149 start_codon:yes stop_codon:yes gene_type:complete
MANSNIKLEKKVYNNKSTYDLMDISFSDLIKIKKPINIKKFFENYNELLYNIPHEGEKSHHFLIKKSSEYLNDGIDPLDDEIDKLVEKIEKLEDKITNKEITGETEHPFFSNGTFLRTHGWEIEVINSLPQGLPIWVMQDGSKREFKNYETYKTIKKALGFDLEIPDLEICELVSVGEINKIPTGAHINKDADINLPIGEDKEIDYNLGDIVDYYSAQITCLEGSNIDPNAYQPSNYITRMGICRIKHYTLSGVESRRNINPGETAQVYYRKNDPYTPGNNDGMVWRAGYMKEEYTYPEGEPSIYFNDPRISSPPAELKYLKRREVKKGEFGEWDGGNPKPGKTRDYVLSQDGNWYGEKGKYGSNDWKEEIGIIPELTKRFS